MSCDNPSTGRFIAGVTFSARTPAFTAFGAYKGFLYGTSREDTFTTVTRVRPPVACQS